VRKLQADKDEVLNAEVAAAKAILAKRQAEQKLEEMEAAKQRALDETAAKAAAATAKKEKQKRAAEERQRKREADDAAAAIAAVAAHENAMRAEEEERLLAEQRRLAVLAAEMDREKTIKRLEEMRAAQLSGEQPPPQQPPQQHQQQSAASVHAMHAMQQQHAQPQSVPGGFGVPQGALSAQAAANARADRVNSKSWGAASRQPSQTVVPMHGLNKDIRLAWIPKKMYLELQLSQAHVGKLIGKSGKVIAAVRAKSGAIVTIAEQVSGSGTRVCTIGGKQAARDAAKELIEELYRNEHTFWNGASTPCRKWNGRVGSCHFGDKCNFEHAGEEGERGHHGQSQSAAASAAAAHARAAVAASAASANQYAEQMAYSRSLSAAAAASAPVAAVVISPLNGIGLTLEEQESKRRVDTEAQSSLDS
jgi:hypothetical protein